MAQSGEKSSLVSKGRKGQVGHFSEKEFCGVGMTFAFKNTFYGNDRQNTESKKYTGYDNKKEKENYEHYTWGLAFKFLMCSLLTFLQLSNIILKRPQLRDLTLKHW